MNMVGCTELPAQLLHYLGGSTVQGSWSLCTSLGILGMQCYFWDLLSSPCRDLWSYSRGTCQPRSSFSWRRRPAMEPAA